MTEVPPGKTPEEVRRALAEQIGSGRLRPGQRLGAERSLAAEFGVSRATLRPRQKLVIRDLQASSSHPNDALDNACTLCLGDISGWPT